MKKLLFLVTVLCVLAVGFLNVSAQDISVIVDNDVIEFDVPPMEINGRTLVPLRKIFEVLGATVDYDGLTREITAKKGDKVIKLTVDDNKLDVNGKITTLDVPATVTSGRTLVPARAVSEALECTVGWDEETLTVIITSKEKSKELKIDPTGKLLATADYSVPKEDISLKSNSLAIEEGELVVKSGSSYSTYEKNEKIYTWEHKSMDVFHFSGTIKHPELVRDTLIPIEIRLSTATDRKNYVKLTRDITLLKGQTETKVFFNIDFYSEGFYKEFLRYAEDPVRVCYTIYYDSNKLGEFFQQLDYGYEREREFANVIEVKTPVISALTSSGVEVQTGVDFKKYNNIENFKLAIRINATQVPQYFTYPYKVTIYKYGTNKSKKDVVDERYVDFVNYKDQANDQGEHLVEIVYDKKISSGFLGNYNCTVSLFGEVLKSVDFTVARP